MENQDFPMTDGRQLREFNYVGDITNAYLLASQHTQAVGKVLNLGNGHPHTLENVGEMIIEKMHASTKLLKNSIPRRPGESNLYCDNTETKRSIGWVPSVGLSEGLDETIKWYRTMRSDTVIAQ